MDAGPDAPKGGTTNYPTGRLSTPPTGMPRSSQCVIAPSPGCASRTLFSPFRASPPRRRALLVETPSRTPTSSNVRPSSSRYTKAFRSSVGRRPASRRMSSSGVSSAAANVPSALGLWTGSRTAGRRSIRGEPTALRSPATFFIPSRDGLRSPVEFPSLPRSDKWRRAVGGSAQAVVGMVPLNFRLASRQLGST